MGNLHGHADDIVYDLISIQYHALKGGQVYAQYKKDADGHDDVQQFIEQVRREDIDRARRAAELLGGLTSGSVGGKP
jgi:hypothetical protein